MPPPTGHRWSGCHPDHARCVRCCRARSRGPRPWLWGLLQPTRPLPTRRRSRQPAGPHEASSSRCLQGCGLAHLDGIRHLTAELRQALLAQFLCGLEHLCFLLFDVVLDELAQHRHLRVEALILEIDVRKLGEDQLDDVVLLVGLGDDLFRLLRVQLLDGWIEDVLFNHHVSLELLRDLAQHALTLARRAPLGLAKQVFDLAMLLLQQGSCLHSTFLPIDPRDSDLDSWPSHPGPAASSSGRCRTARLRWWCGRRGRRRYRRALNSLSNSVTN